MLIEIQRYRICGACCDSTLNIDGQHVCDCAENAHYRIPTGLYDVELLYSSEAHRKVPTLIPADSSILVKYGCLPILKMGNGIHTNCKGQIIVGTYCIPGVVVRSRDAFMPLYDRINNSMRRGNIVQLKITEL